MDQGSQPEPTAPDAAAVQADWARRAAMLDHDLRTPIGTLASALDLMRAMPDDAQLRGEAMQVMGRQVTRLTALAEALRLLSVDIGAAGAGLASRRGAAPADLKRAPTGQARTHG